MVQLDRLKAAWKLEGTLLAKLENLNPGSSKRPDRPENDRGGRVIR